MLALKTELFECHADTIFWSTAERRAVFISLQCHVYYTSPFLVANIVFLPNASHITLHHFLSQILYFFPMRRILHFAIFCHECCISSQCVAYYTLTFLTTIIVFLPNASHITLHHFLSRLLYFFPWVAYCTLTLLTMNRKCPRLTRLSHVFQYPS